MDEVEGVESELEVEVEDKTLSGWRRRANLGDITE